MTGFNSKRAAAADKLQEPINLLEARRIAAEYGTPDSQVDNGNLYFALMKCLEHIDAQPAQEPVAWAVQGCSKMWRGEFAEIDAKAEAKRIGGTCVAYALYTAPQQRLWVGLTEEEIRDCLGPEAVCIPPGWSRLTRAIEAKLKEKNS